MFFEKNKVHVLIKFKMNFSNLVEPHKRTIFTILKRILHLLLVKLSANFIQSLLTGVPLSEVEKFLYQEIKR